MRLANCVPGPWLVTSGLPDLCTIQSGKFSFVAYLRLVHTKSNEGRMLAAPLFFPPKKESAVDFSEH